MTFKVGDLFTGRKNDGTLGPQGVAILNGLETSAHASGTFQVKAGDGVASFARALNFAASPMEHVPTVTWAATTATGLTSPVEYRPQKCGLGSQTVGWDGLSDPNFRYFPGTFSTANGGSTDLALQGDIKPGGNAQAARWPLVAEFVTDAANAVVEIVVYFLYAAQSFQVEVNGQYLWGGAYIPPMQGNSNSARMTLTFPVAASRRIRISTQGLAYVRVPTGGSISKPTTTIGRRIALVGDSWVNGSSGSSLDPPGTINTETFPWQLARLMGADSIIAAGIGGTGWVAGMDGATPNPYSTRLSAVLAMNPQVIVFVGSINDGAGTGVQAAVQDALATCASVPEIYVMGPPLPSYGPNLAAVKAGVAAAGNAKHIDLTSAFAGSTGNITAPSSNRSAMLMPDNAHPTKYGHAYLAEQAYRSILNS